MPTTPPLITLEGIDKAGKGTVYEKLKEDFVSPTYTSEPNEKTWTGEHIRSVLQGKKEADEFAVFAMFVIDHFNHIEKVIQPELENGNAVISDRYIDSRYAYQQEALKELVPGDTLDWIKEIQESRTIKPDLTILLDISVEESIRRQGKEPAEMFENKQFLTKVRENYIQLSEEEPGRYVVIDGERPKKEVYKDVKTTIQEYL